MRNSPSTIINYKKKQLSLLNFFSNNKRILIPLLFISSYILLYFLIDVSSQSLVAHDEGLYARRSRLVEQSINWFSPPFSGPHHKTVGSYWFMALSIRLLGNNELAVRLPSILSSFLCLFILYFISLNVSNKKTALISIFSLSSMPLWIKYSRYGSPDISFVLCILLVIFCFLKYLKNFKTYSKYFYIFLSGLFISVAFFIRSYMVFVPIIGLSPFLVFNLLKSENKYKITFLFGIFFGSIPTILNLYYSFIYFGKSGISSLFDFAKEQVIGEFYFTNILLAPLNFLYLTFPIGILFLILFIFTKPNNKLNYPLLTYGYPFLSYLIILCMSTSYPHYYLFILPSLSICFAHRIQMYSFRFSFSKISIKYILIFFNIIIVSIILLLILFFNKTLILYYQDKLLIIYIVSFVFALSLLYSLRYLFDSHKRRLNLLMFFYNIIIPQYISLSLFYNFGIIGSPNFKTKLFLNDESVSIIANTNTIYLYNVDSKINTLLSYYLPSSKVLSTFDSNSIYKYIITSDTAFLNSIKQKKSFKLIKNFDNHFLLINLGNY